MAQAFPDGWTVTQGELGTDITTSASQALSGGISIHFPSTAATNAILVSDWIPIPKYTTRVTPRRYGLFAAVYSDSIDSARKVRIIAETANPTKTTLNTITIYDAAMPNLSRYDPLGQVVTPATTEGWIRYKIDRSDQLDFNLYLDNVEIKQVPASSDFTASGSPFSSSWTGVSFGGTLHGLTGTSGGDAVIYAPGRYSFSGQVVLDDSYDDGDMFGIRVVTKNFAGTIQNYYYGSVATLSAAYNAATNHMSLTVSGEALFDSFYSEGSYPVRAELQLIQFSGSVKSYGDVQLQVTRITDR